MSCTICEKRKEKRFCPAVHGKICALCCGTEREVSLDCPSECIYLQEARKHERRRPEEIDRAALFPELEIREEFIYEHEPLITGLSYGITKRVLADGSLNDRDIIAGLTTLAKRRQTLVNSGLYVSETVASPAQQAIMDELERMVAQYREMEQKHLGYSALRESEVLLAVVFILRMAHARTSGRPRSRALIDYLLQQLPVEKSVLAPNTSSLVVP